MTVSSPNQDNSGLGAVERLSAREIFEVLGGVEVAPEEMKALGVRIFGEKAALGSDFLGRAQLLDGRDVKIGMRDAEKARAKNPTANIERFSTDCARTPARLESVILYVPTEGARKFVTSGEEAAEDGYLQGLAATYLRLQAMVFDQMAEQVCGERTKFGAVLRAGKVEGADAKLKAEANQLVHNTADFLTARILDCVRSGELRVDIDTIYSVADLIGCSTEEAQGMALELLARTKDIVTEVAYAEITKKTEEGAE